jgi:hypothetical protein
VHEVFAPGSLEKPRQSCTAYGLRVQSQAGTILYRFCGAVDERGSLADALMLGTVLFGVGLFGSRSGEADRTRWHKSDLFGYVFNGGQGVGLKLK